MPPRSTHRTIGVEDLLARRVKYEREKHRWTHTGLAARMTEVGCAMNQSAIWKIENGEPRRRITVDEAAAFAKVFGMTVSQLVVDPSVVFEHRLRRFVSHVAREVNNLYNVVEGVEELDEALDRLLDDTDALDDGDEEMRQLQGRWRDQREALVLFRGHLSKAMSELVEGNAALQILELTDDETADGSPD